MIKDRFFLPVVSYLAGIGENTGDLDVMMLRSADLLENQVLYGFTDEQRDEIAFYRGFHTLFDAGIPALRSTRIIAELSGLTNIGPKREALEEMGDKIAGMANLKESLDSLGEYITSDVKDKFTYINLDHDLFRISKYLERKYTTS
jgi:type II secretory pathway component PulF